jgi:DNA-binding response OmpR family regulator
MTTRILVVEDDPSLGLTLCERLREEAYAVDHATTCAAAGKLLRLHQFDLVLLDVGLPDGDGFSLVEELRPSAPIIFLTAMTGAEERLRGFELGAADYVPKPFLLKELLLRIKKILAPGSNSAESEFNGLVIDWNARAVRHQDGRLEHPQTRDFEVLQFLVKNKHRVVSRHELVERFWNQDKLSSERTVDNSVLRIRQFLAPECTDFVRSVRGIGYQWSGVGVKK